MDCIHTKCKQTILLTQLKRFVERAVASSRISGVRMSGLYPGLGNHCKHQYTASATRNARVFFVGLY